MTFWKAFDEAPAYLRIGFGTFAIGLFGIFIGFAAQALASPMLARIAVIITIVGVITCFLTVAAGLLYLIIRSFRYKRP